MFSKFFPNSHGSRGISLVAVAAIAGVAMGLAAPAVHATLLVDESFNYSGLANGANMSGVTASGTGLSGTYSATGGGMFGYDATGLSLGNLVVSGGSVLWQGTATKGTLSAAISAHTTSSTLYGSYLFSLNNVGGNQVAAALIGPDGGYDSNSRVDPSSQAYGTALYGVPGGAAALSNESIYGYLSGSPQAVGTTYMCLFQVSGVGATSGAATISEWILNASQYDYFAGSGSLTASALNAASTGTEATNVLESGTVSGTPTPTNGYPTLVGQYLDFFGFTGRISGNDAMTFADYRLSNSSLAEAAPVATPEPATLCLLGIGALGLLLLKRRGGSRQDPL